MGHCYESLQKSTVISPKRAFCTRLPPKVTRQDISHETSSKIHSSSLQNERFVRDFLKNSRFESAKQAFRTRLPPKVTRQVSKTSVSYETSSNSHMSKSPKRAFRTRLLPKVKLGSPIGAHTSSSPAKQFRDSSPSKQRPLTRQSQCPQRHSPPPQLANSPFPAPARIHTSNVHKVLRLPRNVTSITPRNLTIPCACQENRTTTSTPQKKHKVLRLPRKVTISYHVSFNNIIPKSPCQLRLVTKTQLQCNT